MLPRINAAILGVFFLCASIVLPDLDAMLYHGVLSQQETQSHVEAAGNPSCHAENCVLSAVSIQLHRAGAFYSLERQAPASDLPRPVDPSVPSFSPAGTCCSRAPPALHS